MRGFEAWRNGRPARHNLRPRPVMARCRTSHSQRPCMTLSVAIQMDPVEGINIETDTTFQLMLEAQTRGHGLWVYTPDKLSLEDGKVTARGRPLNLRAVK